METAIRSVGYERPAVLSLADGGLLLHWTRGNDSLDIEIDAEGDVLACLKKDGFTQATWFTYMHRQINEWLGIPLDSED